MNSDLFVALMRRSLDAEAGMARWSLENPGNRGEGGPGSGAHVPKIWVTETPRPGA